MYIAEICLKGSMSQKFDTGLSFCLMLCRRRDFEKIIPNTHKSYLLFVIK